MRLASVPCSDSAAGTRATSRTSTCSLPSQPLSGSNSNSKLSNNSNSNSRTVAVLLIMIQYVSLLVIVVVIVSQGFIH